MFNSNVQVFHQKAVDKAEANNNNLLTHASEIQTVDLFLKVAQTYRPINSDPL